MYPPPEIEIGLNMNTIGTKIISREVIKYILPIYDPLPLPLSDSMPEQETGEFQFQMDIWTRTPSTTLLQPKKDEMLIFGLRSTSDDRPGWLMDSNPICPIQYKESWILSKLQLFQSFPTEVAQNDSEQPILLNLQLFQSFSTKVAQIMRQCLRPPPLWNGIVGIQFFRFHLGLGPVLG